MKKYAIVSGGIIQNVAVWDGITNWSPSSMSGEITSRHLKIGQTYISMSEDNSAWNILIDGSSLPIHAGYRAVENGLLAAGLSDSSYINVASGGRSTSYVSTTAATLVDSRYSPVHGNKNVCILWEIINDLISGKTAIQAFDSVKNYCIARQAMGFKTIVATCLPWTLSGNGLNEKRIEVNTMLRLALANNESWLNALADIASDEIIGSIINCSDTAYYSDGVHLTNTGHAIAKTYFTSAINQVAA